MAAKCEVFMNCNKNYKHLQKSNMTAKQGVMNGSQM